MKYDIKKIPFSRYGSYFVISQDIKTDKIYLRDLHGGDEAPSNIYEILFHTVSIEDIEICACETKIQFSQKATQNSIEIVFGKYNTIHVKLHGLSMVLKAIGTRYDSLISVARGQWEHFLYSKERKIMFTSVEGEMKALGTWEIVGSKNAALLCNEKQEEAYFVIENYRTVWKQKEYEAFEEIEKQVRQEYDEWKCTMPAIEGVYEEQTKLATYLLWVNFVKAEGVLVYDSLYCSKNWMYNIWSWDNCFMSIALSHNHPEKSYEQLKVFFGIQDECGCYPDYANDRFASYSCCKPPIHAWAFRKMRTQHHYFNQMDILLEAYESFKKVTYYWINYRIKSDGALPEYNHGNDSGWDNASVFHRGVPIESPDLTAYLIRQIDILKLMAEELHKDQESVCWKYMADALYEKLMRRHYDGKQFFAIHVPSGEKILEGDCLILYLPIVIGYRLQKDVLDKLVHDMEERFEATYGLCTENPNSSYYKTGGYWLGPIWAPVTYIIIDALRENGYFEMARRLSEKFCQLTKIGLMAENFDPFTGIGYDDPAFSWTSSVFLKLLEEYPDVEER